MEQWDTTPEEARATLATVARRLLCADGEFSQHVRAFARDETCRAEWPEALRVQVAALRFIPVVERVIERQHSLIKKAAGYSRAGPVKVSLAIRGHAVLERMLSRRPGSLDDLVRHFGVAREIRRPALGNGSDFRGAIAHCTPVLFEFLVWFCTLPRRAVSLEPLIVWPLRA